MRILVSALFLLFSGSLVAQTNTVRILSPTVGGTVGSPVAITARAYGHMPAELELYIDQHRVSIERHSWSITRKLSLAAGPHTITVAAVYRTSSEVQTKITVRVKVPAT